MMPSLSDLLRLKKSQTKPAAEIFARAFQDDILYSWLIPDANKRKELLPYYFHFRIRYGVLFGEVHVISPKLEGVAVWVHSKNTDMTQWRMFRAGGMSLYFKLGKAIISKLESIEEYVSAIHKRHADFPHWHLSPMAVDPVFQGKGYARVLLKAMLARIDQEQLPCFLETQSEKNVAIYKRYGFEIVETGTIPGTEISHWAMLRKEAK